MSPTTKTTRQTRGKSPMKSKRKTAPKVRSQTAADRDEQARLWAELEASFEKTHAAIALSGTVPCKVDAGYGSIRVGDLLTVSPTAGHAMRAADPAPQGTVLGKALESLEAGTGTIKVLVMNR